MSQPFIGEIKMFAGNFAIQGWAFCDGSLQAISQNDALFTLLGTTYGGDGQTTFALPDLRGRVPIHHGTEPTGGTSTIGQLYGAETVTLTVSQIPQHTHQIFASANPASTSDPTGAVTAAGANAQPPNPAVSLYRNKGAVNLAQMGSTTTNFGNSQAHENMQPYTCINYIISLFGIFPSQN